MNRPNGTAHVDATVGVQAGQITLQRGANGRYALTDMSGAWLEADAAAFVEIEQ